MMHTMSVPRSVWNRMESVPCQMHRIVTMPSGNGIPTEIKVKKGESSRILEVVIQCVSIFGFSFFSSFVKSLIQDRKVRTVNSEF
jgi:hypothetical protein